MVAQETPLLSVRDLRTHFPLEEGTVVAVDGVSLDVYDGRTLGIVGESGCGKSVTARSILRLLDKPGRIVDGQILFRRPVADSEQDHEEVVDLAQLDPDGKVMRSVQGGEISLIFQEPMSSLSPVHTVGKQITETIRLHRETDKKKARAIAIELLQRVGIPLPEQRIDAYTFQLSGGLRQRAMIAMALSCNPRLLIADEPTTALDVTTQAQILELMRGLQQEYGMAMILITHNLGVIAQNADDVAVMYMGKVIESGAVDDVFYEPKHPYTRALLRSIPRIRANTRERLDSIAGSVPHPYDLPEGCHFHPRCPSFIAHTCEVRVPSLQPIGDGHKVACFLHHDAGQSHA